MSPTGKRLVRAVVTVPLILLVWFLTGTLVFALTGSTDAASWCAVAAEIAAAATWIWWVYRHPVEMPRQAPTDAGVWLAPPARRAVKPRPFEPFGSCPCCSLPGYHLLSPPREQQDPVKAWAWALAVGQVWSLEGTYEMRNQAPVSQFRVLPTITVVDRECLSCGETWLETM